MALPLSIIGNLLRLRRLPDRYAAPWQEPFRALITRELQPGSEILDVGPGRKPSLDVNMRPPGCHWVGLDISATELQLAPAGSYDSVVIADVERPIAELNERFDLIVSWQALEHVRHVDRALTNLHSYLRPKARFVALVSGRFAFFALANKVVPHRMATTAMNRLLGRPNDTVFPAHYDHCTYSALMRLLAGWHDVLVVPQYRGAGYLSFSAPLQSVYIAYENLVLRKHVNNLATHYLISAAR